MPLQRLSGQAARVVRVEHPESALHPNPCCTQGDQQESQDDSSKYRKSACHHIPTRVTKPQGERSNRKAAGG